jgi:hypothetical protein
MKRYGLICLVLCLLLSVGSQAQEDVKIVKKDFKVEKEGFRDAWENIRIGNDFYDLGGGVYPDALDHFRLALVYNSENPELNYKAGVCCLFGDSPEEALDYFLAAKKLNPEVSQDLLLLTGLAYQSRSDFGMALDCYNQYSDLFLESDLLNPIVNRYIRESNRAIEMAANTVNAEILNLGESVNSVSDDYAPITTMNNSILYFTSRRSINLKGERNSADMKFDENVFLATLKSGVWSDAGVAGKNVSTELNEGVLYVDPTNKSMYIYAGWSGNGDIFISESKKGKWTDPVNIGGGVNSQARETSFSIRADSNERFFTSDRKKGGFGGRDIWYSKRIKKEKWSKPVNLGDIINSTGNEESVWVSATGDTLWFSSNGHDGVGGYDIYTAFRNEAGIWSLPENMGMPVNSQWDDLFYRPIKGEGNRAYISSNRPGGNGGFDIYEVIIESVADTVLIDLVEPIIDTIPQQPLNHLLKN